MIKYINNNLQQLVISQNIGGTKVLFKNIRVKVFPDPCKQKFITF